jgi:hypothetical protein
MRAGRSRSSIRQRDLRRAKIALSASLKAALETGVAFAVSIPVRVFAMRIHSRRQLLTANAASSACGEWLSPQRGRLRRARSTRLVKGTDSLNPGGGFAPASKDSGAVGPGEVRVIDHSTASSLPPGLSTGLTTSKPDATVLASGQCQAGRCPRGWLRASVPFRGPHGSCRPSDEQNRPAWRRRREWAQSLVDPLVLDVPDCCICELVDLDDPPVHVHSQRQRDPDDEPDAEGDQRQDEMQKVVRPLALDHHRLEVAL